MVCRAVHRSKQPTLPGGVTTRRHQQFVYREGHDAKRQTGEVSGVALLFLKRCKYIPVLSIWAPMAEQRNEEFTNKCTGGWVSRASGIRASALAS